MILCSVWLWFSSVQGTIGAMVVIAHEEQRERYTYDFGNIRRLSLSGVRVHSLQGSTWMRKVFFPTKDVRWSTTRPQNHGDTDGFEPAYVDNTSVLTLTIAYAQMTEHFIQNSASSYSTAFFRHTESKWRVDALIHFTIMCWLHLTTETLHSSL